MGHVRNYTIGDVISRYQRMTGRNVLQRWVGCVRLRRRTRRSSTHTAPANGPTPTSGHARAAQGHGLRDRLDPRVRHLRTSYYVHEHGCSCGCSKKACLRKNSVVNWDPVDHTVLANEQVIDGRAGVLARWWRSARSAVVPEDHDYAQELLDGLDALPGWPDSARPCSATGSALEGLEFGSTPGQRPAPGGVHHASDTLMGVTFVSIAASIRWRCRPRLEPALARSSRTSSVAA